MKDWIAFLVGVLVVVLLHLHFYKTPPPPAAVEHFATGATYTETVANGFPQLSALRTYLSSFSDGAYDAARSKWCDLTTPTLCYTVTTASPQTTIKTTGLALRNTKLTGPSSDSFGNRLLNNYQLPSFTAAFYGRLTGISGTSPATLLTMFCENPNHVEFSLREKDATNLYIQAIIGNYSTLYRWEIPKTTFFSNGDPALCTFVYNSHTDVTMYLGTTRYNTIALDTETEPIKLGNTEVVINSNTNMVGDLFAFAWFDAALAASEVLALNTYLAKEFSGVNAALQLQQASANSTITTMKGSLEDQVNKNTDLQAAVDQCRADLAKAKTAVEPPKPKWQISLDGAKSLDTKESQKCGILGIAPFGKKDQPPVVTDESAGLPKPSERKHRFAIPYPPFVGAATAVAPPVLSSGSVGVGSTTPSVAPAPTPAASPTTTSAPATTTAPAPTTSTPTATSAVAPAAPSTPSTSVTNVNSGDVAFWQGLFGYVNDQKAKNDKVETAPVDLNKTYNDLAKSVQQTDKTTPGPAARILQDPPKPAATTAPESAAITGSGSGLGAWLAKFF